MVVNLRPWVAVGGVLLASHQLKEELVHCYKTTHLINHELSYLWLNKIIYISLFLMLLGFDKE